MTNKLCSKHVTDKLWVAQSVKPLVSKLVSEPNSTWGDSAFYGMITDMFRILAADTRYYPVGDNKFFIRR
jgi:hypothetical protein